MFSYNRWSYWRLWSIIIIYNWFLCHWWRYICWPRWFLRRFYMSYFLLNWSWRRWWGWNICCRWSRWLSGGRRRRWRNIFRFNMFLLYTGRRLVCRSSWFLCWSTAACRYLRCRPLRDRIAWVSTANWSTWLWNSRLLRWLIAHISFQI